MSRGIYKKLARARSVAEGAGFLLERVFAQYGDQMGVGMSIQIRQAIHECRQQGAALVSLAAANAKEADVPHERRLANIESEGKRT